VLTVNNPSIIASSSWPGSAGAPRNFEFFQLAWMAMAMAMALGDFHSRPWPMLYVNCADINHGSFDCPMSRSA